MDSGMAHAVQAMSDDLDNLFRYARGLRFVWGEHDCSLFAALAFDLRKGTDLHGLIKRLWPVRSERDYRRLLAARSLTTMTKELLGTPWSGDPLRGDIVIANNGGAEVLAVASPPIVLLPGPFGLEALGMAYVVDRWDVEAMKDFPCRNL